VGPQVTKGFIMFGWGLFSWILSFSSVLEYDPLGIQQRVGWGGGFET